MGEALLVRCGTIEAGFAYDLPTRTLTVHILQAKEVPSKERGGAANTQVRKHIRTLRGADQHKHTGEGTKKTNTDTQVNKYT